MVITSSLLNVIVDVLVLGVVAWLVNLAPFIAQPFKQFITYALIVIAVVIVIIFLLGLTGTRI